MIMKASFNRVWMVALALGVTAALGADFPSKPVKIVVSSAPGSPSPAVATVAQFQQALKNARRVAYIDPEAGGPSGIYLDGLFERWGMRDEIRAKAILFKGGLVATRLLDGSADLAIHQISEIKAVAGVTLVGPIPAEIQNRTVYAAALPGATAPEPVAQLLTFLTSVQRAPLLQDKGMEPMASSR